jgi:prepilin-type processing-associated H-X9-DG protein
VYKIDKPAQFILIADSIGWVDGWGTCLNQSYLFNLSGGPGGVIHLRHNGLANIVFADGHVAACDKTRIKEAALAEVPSTTVIKVIGENATKAAGQNVPLVQINP